ncbi:hypothetical protein [Corynebacterium sp. HS2168-gen11]|uniref:hypothetical protein n=1 Tax=Corynebacterium sp. HS2168-gen11 TaxID=2974027 RepID=UPI00216AF634|nr:hypothetical protein [Corynebacterium sp. HS2168-gen11]MCS4535452.1 hypothetical protein [Corynebacterium sp. HS2168-gen11]
MKKFAVATRKAIAGVVAIALACTLAVPAQAAEVVDNYEVATTDQTCTFVYQADPADQAGMNNQALRDAAIRALAEFEQRSGYHAEQLVDDPDHDRTLESFRAHFAAKGLGGEQIQALHGQTLSVVHALRRDEHAASLERIQRQQQAIAGVYQKQDAAARVAELEGVVTSRQRQVQQGHEETESGDKLLYFAAPLNGFEAFRDEQILRPSIAALQSCARSGLEPVATPTSTIESLHKPVDSQASAPAVADNTGVLIGAALGAIVLGAAVALGAYATQHHNIHSS